MKDYLLGKLGDSEAAAVELKYFTDRRFLLRMRKTETRMIEDYLRGRLPSDDLRRFEERYLQIPQLRLRLDAVRKSLNSHHISIVCRWTLVVVLTVVASGVWYGLRPAPEGPRPPRPVARIVP